MDVDKYRVTNGVKKDVVLRGSSDEIEITKQFSKFFGITFSREENFKFSAYTLNFLQPNIELQRNYNLFNEVLLLFSNYPSFDTRTFDFIDKTMDDYSNRLDKLCVFIVSADSNFTETIARHVEKQKDFRLVVPFTYEEILSSNLDENLLHTRLRSYLYSRDLFAFESPLKSDEYFYGRSQLVQTLYSKYSFGQQSGLFGLRKIGKTSVLYALERTLKHVDGRSLYIGCDSPSIHRIRWYKLLELLIIQLAEKYDLSPLFRNLNFNEQNAQIQFENNIKQLYKYFDNKRILFIFDEIENITYELSPSEHWNSDSDFLYFWQSIRSTFQKNPEIFCFILAGVNPKVVETSLIKGQDNPIFSMIEKIYLNFFDIKNVREMVSRIGGYMGLFFEEEIYTYLVEDYGGHPFLIRQVCSLLNKSIKHKPATIDKITYKSLKKNFDNQLSSYVEQIIGVLKNSYSHEFDLISILANEGNDEFLDEITNRDEINHLIGYGILAHKNNYYSITINAISEYLQTNYIRKKVPKKIEEKWAIISKRRNKLEVKLRSLIINALESQKGKATTKNIILGVKETSVRDKIKGGTITEIVENNYYFSDYKTIILKEWPLFDKLFIDKSKFHLYIDIISDFRADAHAKNITDENYTLLSYALDWFDKIID